MKPEAFDLPSEPEFPSDAIDQTNIVTAIFAIFLGFTPVMTWAIGATNPLSALMGIAGSLQLAIYWWAKRPGSMELSNLTIGTICWIAAAVLANVVIDSPHLWLTIVAALSGVMSFAASVLIGWNIYKGK